MENENVTEKKDETLLYHKAVRRVDRLMHMTHIDPMRRNLHIFMPLWFIEIARHLIFLLPMIKEEIENEQVYKDIEKFLKTKYADENYAKRAWQKEKWFLHDDTRKLHYFNVEKGQLFVPEVTEKEIEEYADITLERADLETSMMVFAIKNALENIFERTREFVRKLQEERRAREEDLLEA